jgi:hypothetical protein
MPSNEILRDAGIFSLQEEEVSSSTTSSSFISTSCSYSSASYSSASPNPYIPAGVKGVKPKPKPKREPKKQYRGVTAYDLSNRTPIKMIKKAIRKYWRR